eukprot:5730357-Pyramimonas_sp.AAC.1
MEKNRGDAREREKRKAEQTEDEERQREHSGSDDENDGDGAPRRPRRSAARPPAHPQPRGASRGGLTQFCPDLLSSVTNNIPPPARCGPGP